MPHKTNNKTEQQASSPLSIAVYGEITRRYQESIEAFSNTDYSKAIFHLHHLGSMLSRIGWDKMTDRSNISPPDIPKGGYDDEKPLLTFPFREFNIFNGVWDDPYLDKKLKIDGVGKSRWYLKAKAELDRESRQHIHLALLFIRKRIAKKVDAGDTLPDNATTRKINITVRRDNADDERLELNEVYTPTEDPENDPLLIDLDKKASEAIRAYKPFKLRLLYRLARVIAILQSLTCSITTASAVAITLATWPGAIVGPITLLVFATYMILNCLNFVYFEPRLLHDIFGEKRLFGRWLRYNEIESGKKVDLTTKRKLALGGVTTLVAGLSAVAGAITYGYIMGLGNLSLFPFLAAGTVGASFLPPVAIALGAIYFFATFALMMKPVLNVVKSRNWKKALFKKPFERSDTLFSTHTQSEQKKNAPPVSKNTLLGLFGFFSVPALFGLGVLQVQDGIILTHFIHAGLAVTSSIAVGIAWVFCLAMVVMGQLPYTLRTISNNATYFLKTLHELQGNPHSRPQKTNGHGVFDTLKNTIVSSVAYTLVISCYLPYRLAKWAINKLSSSPQTHTAADEEQPTMPDHLDKWPAFKIAKTNTMFVVASLRETYFHVICSNEPKNLEDARRHRLEHYNHPSTFFNRDRKSDGSPSPRKTPAKLKPLIEPHSPALK